MGGWKVICEEAGMNSLFSKCLTHTQGFLSFCLTLKGNKVHEFFIERLANSSRRQMRETEPNEI